MEAFTKIINFIMGIIDLFKNLFNKNNDDVEQNPAPDVVE